MAVKIPCKPPFPGAKRITDGVWQVPQKELFRLFPELKKMVRPTYRPRRPLRPK